MVVGSAMEQRYDCNVVLVGDCKVGKTALANRFVSTKFSEVRLRTNRPLSSVMGTLVGRPSFTSETRRCPTGQKCLLWKPFLGDENRFIVAQFGAIEFGFSAMNE